MRGYDHEDLKRFQEGLKRIIRARARTEMSFGQLACFHIKRAGWSKQVFYEKTLLSERTFERITADALKGPSPRLETVMALCIGLELGLALGTSLLGSAGYTLTNSPLHCAYQHILASCCGKDILDCNEMLIRSGFGPLNGHEYRGYFDRPGHP